MRARVRTFTHEGAVPETANARARWSSRESVVVEVVDDRGHVGKGEASPLPGYSPDALSDVDAALSGVTTVELENGEDVLDAVGREIERLPETLPSARFALETALLDLLGQRLGRPTWALLAEGVSVSYRDGSVPMSVPVPDPVPLAALLPTGAPARVLDAARAHVQRGIHTLKLKIGILPRAEELALLYAFRRELGSAITLRVDANQSLREDELDHTLGALAALDVALVEEPSPLEVVLARARVPVPLALDESLSRSDVETWLDTALSRGTIRALVLKPMLLGGALRCIALEERARAHGVSGIVSHGLDGPIAWAAAASLALALPTRHLAAGLDRHPGLLAFPEVALPGFGDGVIVPTDAPGLGLGSGPPLGRRE